MAARSLPQPPFAADLLADLHADNIDPEQADLLWPQVRRDADAVRFLHALDSVDAELRAMDCDDHIVHPIPPQVAARLDTLIDRLAAGEAPREHIATVHRLHPVSDDEPPSTRPMPALPAGFEYRGSESGELPELSPDPQEPVPLERYRSKRLRWITAAAAAVAVIAGSLVAVDAVRDRNVSPNALPAKASPTIALGEDLSSGAVLSAMGRNDVAGRLAGPGAMSGCVKAAVPDRTILGSTNVTYHGEPAVLILLTGPRPPKITALVVGTGCSAADPQIREIRDIG